MEVIPQRQCSRFKLKDWVLVNQLAKQWLRPALILFLLSTFMSTVAVAQQAEAALTALYSFSGPDGSTPVAGLVQAADGSFYGTTATGGASAVPSGTLFQLTSEGRLITIYSFAYTDGAVPRSELLLAADGNFYGTTSSGGASSGYAGTIFGGAETSVQTNLYSFDGSDGGFPSAGLIQASDGSLYGTTHAGGYATSESGGGGGMVFQYQPGGIVQQIFAFDGNDGLVGMNPIGITQGRDGDLYGVTYSGGVSGNGTVYRLSLQGTLTSLYSFNGSDGANPDALLVQGSDGNFYGTTLAGGTGDCVVPNASTGCGTIFKVAPTGELTNLYSFSGGADGGTPYSGLIQARDGNFYGTTEAGGIGKGTIFRITPAGELTTLYSFQGQDGANPQSRLMEADDGSFYGTTTAGGSANLGTLFKLAPAPAGGSLPAPAGLVAQALLNNRVALQWAAVAGAMTYSVYMGAAPGQEGATPVVVGITKAQAVIKHLHRGHSYCFAVAAVDATGMPGIHSGDACVVAK